MKSVWLLGVSLLTFCSASFAQNSTAYTPSELALFADESLKQSIGQLEAGVPIKLLQSKQDASQIELEMWRKKKVSGAFGITNFPNKLPMR
ncbi:cytochrome c-type protein [Actinobacillus ureae]|nr:cytochrome c-type protein [Actinobacillus ureae]SUU49180.1 cytochrome c-type protein [Actinobacillus ureae]